MQLAEINPTVIYKDKISLGDSLEKEEFLDNLISNNVGLSQRMDVLDLDLFSDLRSQVYSHIKWYEQNICGFNEEISLYITDSWYRETIPGNDHPIHNHPNSLLSGVIYLNVPENSGHHSKLNFETGHFIFKGFHFDYYQNVNKYNAKSTFISVETGDIVIFPSWMEHYVTDNESTNQSRKIISFNTFIKGTVTCRNSFPTTIQL